MNERRAEDLLLFQYGSNMSVERLRARVWHFEMFAPPGASLEVELLGAARISGWRFVLGLYSATQRCLVADMIEAGDGDVVWGALYRLDRELVIRSDGARSVLDRIEGHRPEVRPENYRPRPIAVELDGESKETWTYTGHAESRRRCRAEHSDARPSADYVDAIMDGARALALPRVYVQDLARALGTEAPS